MNHRIVSCVFAVGFLAANSFCVFAAKGNHIEAKRFESTDISAEYDFPKQYEGEDGSLYELEGTETKVLSQEERETSQKSQEFTREGLSSAEYEWSPMQEITYQGKTYIGSLDRNSISYTKNAENATRTTYAVADKTYKDKAEKPEIPQKQVFEVADSLTGEVTSAVLDLIGVEEKNERYDYPVEFPIEFSNYSAPTYVFENVVLRHNDEVCPLNEQPELVLRMLGLSTDLYTIDSIEWTGEWNTEADTRQATAYAKRYACDYVAHYGGNAVFNGTQESYTGTATYLFAVTETIYTLETTASYVLRDTVTTTTTGAIGTTVAPVTTTTSEIKKENTQPSESNAVKKVVAASGSAIAISVCIAIFFFKLTEAIAYNSEGMRICSLTLGNPLNVTGITLKTTGNFTIKLSPSGAKKYMRYTDFTIKSDIEDTLLPFEYDEATRTLKITNTVYTANQKCR